MTRYYRLTGSDGGPMPPESPFQIGTIIRVPRSNSPKPGTCWNSTLECWVTPTWQECDDPKAVQR